MVYNLQNCEQHENQERLGNRSKLKEITETGGLDVMHDPGLDPLVQRTLFGQLTKLE